MSQVSGNELLNTEAMELGDTGKKGGKEKANVETNSGSKNIVKQNESKGKKEERGRSRSPESKDFK